MWRPPHAILYDPPFAKLYRTGSARRMLVLSPESSWYACGRSQTRGLMRRWLNLPLFCFALAAPGIAETCPSKIAITHTSIVEISTGTIKPDMTVLIEGNRITAVRPSKNEETL